jgi:predicted nucleic acid-binding protein
MRREPIRVYADTSVYGGVFDDRFAQASGALFEEVHAGRFRLVTSPLLRTELRDAPEHVRALFDDMAALAEEAPIDPEARHLQQAYIDRGIVAPRRSADALHVAVASVAGCSVLVSWNCRHIVHLAKIRLYNAVNALHGYDALAIHSPSEVITYGED